MILIHICCADCGIKFVDAVKTEYNFHNQDIVLYYYNPNIHPESEWHARLKAIQEVFKKADIELRVANWTPSDYFNEIKKKVEEKKNFRVDEKKYRCPVCWELRLRKTFEYGIKGKFEYISSTLFSSIYHDTDMITKIAQNMEKEYKIKLIIPKNINHCQKTNGFYKQNYEGCVFSLREKYQKKYLDLSM